MVEWQSADQSEQCLIGTVKLTGGRVSGDVHLELPEGFAAEVMAGCWGQASPNRRRGRRNRRALQYARRASCRGPRAAGYPSILSTPKVSRGRRLPPDIVPGRRFAGALDCEGHLLTVMLEIIFRSR